MFKDKHNIFPDYVLTTKEGKSQKELRQEAGVFAEASASAQVSIKPVDDIEETGVNDSIFLRSRSRSPLLNRSTSCSSSACSSKTKTAVQNEIVKE